MSMRFCDQLTEADVRLVKTRLDDFVPREVFDAHTHLFHSRHFAEGKRPEFVPADTAFGLKRFNDTMARWLPGRVVNGLFFGYPSPGNNRAGENEFVAGELAAAQAQSRRRENSTAAAPHPGPLPADAGRGGSPSQAQQATHGAGAIASATDSPLPSLARGEGQGEGSSPWAATGSFQLSRALALLAPEDDPAWARQLIAKHRFVGIKPYRLYAPVADTSQAKIEEFAPEWMWELCNEMDGVLMLHIVRSLGIADERNHESLRRLCRKYPRCRVVLAHVARSFNYRNALAGLARMGDLDNVVVDTGGVTETEAVRAALEILGPRRVLYASDYPISDLRGKCFTMGDGFTWVYADDLPAKAVTPFESFTLVGIESLLCLREACEITGMGDADLRDIFRNNALRLLAPHLDAKNVPPAPSGPEQWTRAQQRIACGTGLLSKRAVSFDPATWPQYYSRCDGAFILDSNGRRYLDFTGGVGAILLGYSDPDVNAAVKRRISLGSYCTLVSPDEVELAELLLALHPWAQRVRYGRGGGEVLAQAVRIARATTGRSGIAFCGYHGWSDWYLAANLGETNALDGHLLPGLQPLGVPRELAGTAVPFRYNDFASFEAALKKLDGKLAGVMMEPMRSEEPRDGFLEKVAAACRAAGGVFMVDEVTSGWRFGFPGACARLGIQPDVVVYAKAISNGFPCAAIIGRSEVMDAANASFISSSYWTDGVGPAAALACVRKMQRVSAQQHVWTLGQKLQSGMRQVATSHPSLRMKIGGMPCAPSLAFDLGADSQAAKTLYVRKLVQRGILASGQYYVMWSHTPAMVDTLLTALGEVCTELTALHDARRLQAEAGSAVGQTGFARLA